MSDPASVIEELHALCREGSDEFSAGILGRSSWAGQDEFARACDTSRRVNCRSANGVGKTHRAAGKIIEKALLNPGSRTIITGPSYDQAHAGLWQEVKRAYDGALIQMPGRFLDSEWRLGTGWEVFVANPAKFSSVQGLRGHDGPTFVWIDEAHAVDNLNYWTALETICQDPESFMCATFNPLWPQGRVYSNLNDHRWTNVKISGWDHPNIGGKPEAITEEWAAAGVQRIRNAISRQWILERFQVWGPNDPNYVARVEGEFPDAGEAQLFPLSYLKACGLCRTGIQEEPRAGHDFARNAGSGDRNATVITNGAREVVHVETWFDDDLTRTAERNHRLHIAFGVPCSSSRTRANGDVSGLGAGAIDAAKKLGCYVKPVNFGLVNENGGWAEVNGREALHANLKAALYDAGRHLVRRSLIKIPPDRKYDGLRDDLREIRREPGGVMKIEDKDKTRKRIGRSPDLADAFVIMLYQGSFTPPTEAQHREMARRLGV